MKINTIKGGNILTYLLTLNGCLSGACGPREPIISESAICSAHGPVRRKNTEGLPTEPLLPLNFPKVWRHRAVTARKYIFLQQEIQLSPITDLHHASPGLRYCTPCLERYTICGIPTLCLVFSDGLYIVHIDEYIYHTINIYIHNIAQMKSSLP